MKNQYIFLSILLIPNIASAGWQYNNNYVNDAGYYSDDGARFVIGARGGISYGTAKLKNQIGRLDSVYEDSESNIWRYDISSLPAKNDFQKIAFVGGANIGFTLPGASQWRIEANWDHINKTEYNEIPLFEGNVNLVSESTGEVQTVYTQSGGVASSISSDVISAMIYYDFFDGINKPINTFIPYVGAGVGYADSKTTLKLSDIYGNFSSDPDLNASFNANPDAGIIQFYESNISNSNIALLGSIGLSYGISQTTFFDLNARVIYIPNIKWQLTNADDTQHRDLFGTDGMLYTNLTLGIRFEF
ncbi:MAG: hypothetical protein MJ158_04325 [Alphaproteobacteria bacterium]|nr:hypothetical protein [Alphaproteobacteria bacterium]